MNRYQLVERVGAERPWVIRDMLNEEDVFSFAAHDERFARRILESLQAKIGEDHLAEAA